MAAPAGPALRLPGKDTKIQQNGFVLRVSRQASSR
jgi:hypothetical protein